MFIDPMLTSAVAATDLVFPRADLASASIEARAAAAHGPSINIAMHTKTSVKVILLRTPGIQTSARQHSNIVTARTNIQSSRTGLRCKR
jgi:hypothetical protein